MGGGITYAKEGSVNFYILYLFESLFACGVDLFMLISGYFMCESKKRNIWKPIELVIQVMIFKEAIYLAKVACHTIPFSIKQTVTTLIPANYFVILYCVVFIMSPFINILIEKLTVRDFRTMIVFSVILFSVIPTIVDVFGEIRGEQFVGLSTVGMYGSQWGYSIVNFLLMYLIGGYLKKGNSKVKRLNNRKLITGLIISIMLLIVWARVNDRVGYFAERSAWEYCNPLIIFEAMVVFVLFSRMNLGVNRVVNYLAEGVFTVFLLHQVFIPHLQIERFVTGNTIIMVLHILCCMVGIYILCWCVHKAYHWITDPVFKKLSSEHAIVLEVEN